MKTTKFNLIAALTIVALALLSFVPVAMAEKHKPVLSKKELKVLLNTAKEPPEHRKIAEHYRQEAQQLTASSKEHAELADVYAKNPTPSMVAKPWDAFRQAASNCRRSSELLLEAAKQAESLAALHEDMAKAAEQKQ